MPSSTSEACAVVDDLIKQHERAAGSQWIKNLDLRRLDTWPERRRGELVAYVADRLSATVDRIRQIYPNPYRRPPKEAVEAGLFALQNEEDLLRKLFNHQVVLNGWPLDLSVLDRVLALITRSESTARIDLEELASLVTARAADYHPTPDAALAIRRILNEHLLRRGRGEQFAGDDDRTLVTALQRLTGNAPLALDPQFPADALMLRDLGVDAPPAWTALIDHCLSCPKSCPSRAWLDRAQELLDAIPADEFAERSARWLDAVRQPISGQLTRGDWAIPEREEAWLSGMAWCVSLRPARETLAALGRLCQTSLKPYEYGQRSLLLASVCVDALASAEHPATEKVLRQLKAKVRHKVVAAAIAKGLGALEKRAASSKPRRASKRRAT
jgi:hypothetical protein